VTYAEKIRKEEARLDWTQSAATLARKIRAFNPSPATFAAIDDASGFKIFDAHVLADAPTDLPAGTIIQADKNGFDIACGQGVLRIIEAQRAGGKRMPAAQFLESLPLQAGVVLL
jgi:methionyl-tRNA formyltransferase